MAASGAVGGVRSALNEAPKITGNLRLISPSFVGRHVIRYWMGDGSTGLFAALCSR